MKKLTPLILIIAILGFNNSLVAQSKKELKEQKKAKEFQAIKSLIESGHYIFTANAAYTQKGRRIDLSLNNGFLKIKGSLVEGDLPYFGVVQVGGYSDDGGINFTQENTQFDIEFNEKKQKAKVKFDAKNKTEQFTLYLTVSPGGSASLSINSSKRNSISYTGKITSAD